MRFIFYLIFLTVMVSCQTPPTKVKENLSGGPNPPSTVLYNDKTIVIDVRPIFSYVNGHLPKAVPLRWEDYSQAKKKGLLRADVASVAKNLAIYGISLSSKVLVLGYGKDGAGEEGRIAWMLSYLGVKDVQFANEIFIAGKRKTGPPADMENAPIWKPVIDLSLIVEKKDFRKILRSRGAVIVDVRSSEEYLARAKNGSPHVDMGAINIDWREFIDKNGRLNAAIVHELEQVGITKDKNIVVISNKGVRSALVTMVFRSLGYSLASNYAGGYEDL